MIGVQRQRSDRTLGPEVYKLVLFLIASARVVDVAQMNSQVRLQISHLTCHVDTWRRIRRRPPVPGAPISRQRDLQAVRDGGNSWIRDEWMLSADETF